MPANTANNLIIPGAGLSSLGSPVIAGAPNGPFDFVSITNAGLLTIFPGTINNLLPNSPFTPLSCAGQTTTYVVLSCTTNSNQVNQASYAAQSTAPTPSPALIGAPPTSFKVLLGIVIQNTSGGSTTYTLYKTLPAGNLLATPMPWIQTSKANPQPGGLPYDQWYTWQISSTK